MTFWIIAMGIAAGIGLILGRALLHGRVGDQPPAAYDLQVYRDQLKDIERDLARAVISEAEAERVRTEVSRRILAADAQLRAGGETGGQPMRSGPVFAVLAALAVGGGALALYARIGAPGYSDLPIGARIEASDAIRATRLSQAEAEAQAEPRPMAEITAEYRDLMEKLRAAVKTRPDDLRGLGLLVRNEAALGNLPAAHRAQAQLIAAKGDAATAEDYAFLADLMITAAGGVVSAEAETTLRAVLVRSPDHPTARYYMGLYMMQVGRPDIAFRSWQGLLDESLPTAPWVPPIRAQIEEVAWRAGVNYELPPLPSQPGAGDAKAAEDMTSAERDEMIRGMVARLSDRLANEGGPPEDWAQLIQSLVVLGEGDRALLIYAEARQVFADSPEALKMLRDRARAIGMPE